MEPPEIKHMRDPSSQPPPQPRLRKKADRRRVLSSRMSVLCLLILILAFATTSVLLLVLPRSTKSLIEKRDLAAFPKFTLESYFSGDFTAGVATYYDDTVPNHDGFKNLGNSFKRLFGLPKSDNSVQFVGKINKITDDNPAKAAELFCPQAPRAAVWTPSQPTPAPPPTPSPTKRLRARISSRIS